MECGGAVTGGDPVFGATIVGECPLEGFHFLPLRDPSALQRLQDGLNLALTDVGAS